MSERIYYQSRDSTTGLSDVKITITAPDNTVAVSAVVMTESITAGVYYYDFTPTMSGIHWIKIDSESMPREVAYSLKITDVSASGSSSATYTTTTKVASFLGFPDFDTNTKPTAAEVTQFIYRAQDYLDMRTGHAWRERTITREYHDYQGIYKDGFLKVKLNHKAIKTLSSATDSIEVWDGTQWLNWLSVGAGKTESRASDYWVDYDNGVLFIKYYGSNIDSFMRITYRYGDSSIPYDIEDAATMYAAIDALLATQRTMSRPDEDENSNVYIWRKKCESIISNRAEIGIVIP
jgi:hypothetical protein